MDDDGFTDVQEVIMGTDATASCPTTGVSDGIDNDNDTFIDESGEGANDEEPDAFPPDGDDDMDSDIGDLIALFGSGKLLVGADDPLYSSRSDMNADGAINIGDVIAGFFDTILTTCA